MFFALSRISNLRLVPLADLANSALPGQCEGEGECECEGECRGEGG